MEKLTLEQAIELMNDVVRQHYENKEGFLGSKDCDNFTNMAQCFLSETLALADDQNKKLDRYRKQCISIVMGNKEYKVRKRCNETISIEQFLECFRRLTKLYSDGKFWLEETKENNLAVNKITTILFNILKDRVIDNPKLLNNLSLNFGGIE